MTVSDRNDGMDAQFDVVIVGGGTAGCILANRLSSNGRRKVLLIEAGRDFPPGTEPADITDTYASSYFNPAYKWPKLRAHWRRKDNSPAIGLEQGRVIGGGSTIMGMIALRGVPQDYDEWSSVAAGWSWSDVLLYFRALETDVDFDGEWHGRHGPITVRRTARHQWPSLSVALADYATSVGLPFIADMNADFRDGLAALPLSASGDRRASSAICYLDAPVRQRDNLTILPCARVAGIEFDRARAVGVRVSRDGKDLTFGGREIILSSGAVQSPAILMRSGIGPAEHLKQLGIAVRANLPAVGENLQNHPILFLGVHLKDDHRQRHDLRPHPVTCLRYSSGADSSSTADLYMNVYSKSSWNALGQQIGNINVALLKPKSRGRIALRSTERGAEPEIEFCFLDDAADLERLMQGFSRCVEFAVSSHVRELANFVFPVQYSDRLRLLQQRNSTNMLKASAVAWALDRMPSLGSFMFNALTGASIDLAELIRDPEALAEHVRRNVGGTFHLAGTCRMGGSFADSVVDANGRVHGIQGLRVIDASIMPTIPRGNTFLPTAMLAEKLSASALAE